MEEKILKIRYRGLTITAIAFGIAYSVINISFTATNLCLYAQRIGLEIFAMPSFYLPIAYWVFFFIEFILFLGKKKNGKDLLPLGSLFLIISSGTDFVSNVFQIAIFGVEAGIVTNSIIMTFLVELCLFACGIVSMCLRKKSPLTTKLILSIAFFIFAFSCFIMAVSTLVFPLVSIPYWFSFVFFLLFGLSIIFLEIFSTEKESQKEEKKLNSLEELDKVKALREYKDLLDKNVITQEEFDKKKKDILS